VRLLFRVRHAPGCSARTHIAAHPAGFAARYLRNVASRILAAEFHPRTYFRPPFKTINSSPSFYSPLGMSSRFTTNDSLRVRLVLNFIQSQRLRLTPKTLRMTLRHLHTIYRQAGRSVLFDHSKSRCLPFEKHMGPGFLSLACPSAGCPAEQ